MAKKLQFTQIDMDKIDQMVLANEEQNKVLKEILICLKGSKAVDPYSINQIGGLLPTLQRLEIIVEELVQWKKDISIYLGIFANKRFWKIFLGFLIVILSILLSVKYGFTTIWQVIIKFIKP